MSGRSSIQGRLLTLVGAGVFIAGAALSLLSRSSLRALERDVLAEHERVAQVVAGSISATLDDDLRLLATAATAPYIDLSDGSDAAERATLESALLHTRLWASLFFVDPSGVAVVAAPAYEQPVFGSEAVVAAAARAIQAQRPVVSSVIVTDDGTEIILGIVPLRAAEGRPGGAVAGVFPLPARRLRTLLQGTALAPHVRLELMDDHQRLVAASSDIRDPEAGAALHAPVAGAPWSVVMMNVGSDPLGPVATFRRRSLWLAPSLAALAMFLAWGIARSVRRPLRGLTASAERIARGDLDQVVESEGSRSAGDEIARLASAVEHMRRSLKHSIDQIEQSNRDLETRVEDRTRELHTLNARLKERERVRQDLLRKVISAQEDERKRIARELHDETSQTLAALGIGVDTTLTTCTQPDMRSRLLDLRQLVHRMHKELHRLIVNLRPSVLDDLGLAAAIRWFAAWQLGDTGTAVRCEVESLDVRLPSEIETALFRAVQEAIVNIARHAQADTVLIQGSADGGMITLEIEDDGQGFDLQSAPQDPGSLRGIGLLGMRERIEIIGGSLQIESEPGRGTRLLIRVPVTSPEPRRAETGNIA